MAADTTTAPELTTEQVQSVLVGPLEAASTFLSSGPRVFDVTAAGPVRIPKLTGVTDPDWIGEGELITEKDVSFGEVTLLPSGMKSLKVITKYSSELARSTVIGLDSTLRARLVRDVANKLDGQLLGDGGDGVTTPLGLLAYTGVQEMAAVGTVTLDDLHDAVGLLLSADADPGRARWVMTPGTFTGLHKIKDTSGQYIVQPDVTSGNGYRLLGLPVSVTPRIPVDATPETSVVLADFSTIAVARDLSPSVKFLSELYADYDQLGIRVVCRYDAAPLLPEALVVLRGVTA